MAQAKARKIKPTVFLKTSRTKPKLKTGFHLSSVDLSLTSETMINRFLILVCLAISLSTISVRAQGQANSPEYEQNFMRLAEILGAVHHLWSICHPEDTQKWRDQMMKLLEADAKTPARRARLVNRFNTGYKNIRISYKKCDQTARQAELRFLSEGQALSHSLKLDRKKQ